ncbi:CH domain containing protein [Asbolus verrucosus]|uniref:CH domain containing protein n=1 Tax=Asbolus verrucosus TaxID=1661398 RepID=A0A482VZ24_ASBVE|nr:CH domain containing protein [Asbolus verrucosus]
MAIVFFQVAGKRDPEQEKEAQAWIEAVIGEKFPPGLPYEIALRDGIILCKLMNRLAPGIISKINVSGGDYKMMDNLSQ